MNKVEWLKALDINTLPRRRVRNIMVAVELPWNKAGQFTRLGSYGLEPACVLCGKTAAIVKVYKHIKQDHLPMAWHVDAFDASGVMLNLDFLIPVSWGGSNHKSNLRTLCCKCRSRRVNTPTAYEICSVITIKGVIKDWKLFQLKHRASGLTRPQK